MPSSPTVLIVEDNYLLLEMLTSLCEKHGIRVLAASSGEAALTMLRRRGAEIDWLFTDIALPGLIDGWEVAAAFRECYPRRPIVYASASERMERRTMLGSIFVHKPFQTREIVALAKMIASQAEGQSRYAPPTEPNSALIRGSARHASTRLQRKASRGRLA